jgi:hypothetical protein
MNQDIIAQNKIIDDLTPTFDRSGYSMEYFHIYTDETIDEWHKQGLDIMQDLEVNWDFPYKKIVLIDNYNPAEHRLTAEEILEYLESHGMAPDYWAFEGDMVQNVETFLAALPDIKLKRNYLRYIAERGKYPCSLLTATWYLTRLGRLDTSVIKAFGKSGTDLLEPYKPAERLFNLLPESYKEVEGKARELITKSSFSQEANYIQDFFYPSVTNRKSELI